MQTARIVEAEDGEQIIVFPLGFEIDADEVELTRVGDHLLLTPVTDDTQSAS